MFTLMQIYLEQVPSTLAIADGHHEFEDIGELAEIDVAAECFCRHCLVKLFRVVILSSLYCVYSNSLKQKKRSLYKVNVPLTWQ